ncbi:MAG TPA: amylo-alpha-1,6-glucosidase [Pirellulales bacterium]|jgi:predicted glycogen debranching enzyme|nr:amylo-alpha-1,6-glucosidase [Pirellulales bacterium]
MEAAIVRRLPWTSHAGEQPNLDPKILTSREWLVTNGLGGYASGTLGWSPTRRYHGLLIAALPAPLGRMMMFNHLEEEMRIGDDRVLRLSATDPCDPARTASAAVLTEFRLEDGLPIWRYECGPYVLERRVLLPYRSNTVHLTYRLVSGAGPVWIRLRPNLHFRPHEAAVSAPSGTPYVVASFGDRFEVTAPDMPPLRLHLRGPGAALVLDGGRFHDVEYALERDRGYDFHGTLWSPGYFRADVTAHTPVTLGASTEPWEAFAAIDPDGAWNAELERRQRLVAQADPRARSGFGAELVIAADQFIITPTTRVADATRAHAAGDEIRSVIAGYHWFTDWGRDTMIALEGLTLATGRQNEAGYILRTFSHYVRDGLIPNLFPEGERTAVYHTADATLWFFEALNRYLNSSGDRLTLRLLLPILLDIVEHHLRGTQFGIGVDPADGLLKQGADGYQLTWMDAKVGDWVVTPRRGKAVEINALWYNALRLLAGWLAEEEQPQQGEIAGHAERAFKSFNARFWIPERGFLYDVIDGEGPDDASLRPNQIFAISLPHPVLDRERWTSVLRVVTERLLTPMGLRTLAPGEPQYKPRYDGDLRSRDAAYHQGTVWPWLIGPFIDAWLKLHPGEFAATQDFLAGFAAHLGEACIGTISEIFDAEAPYSPRGCAAQAWSVAEVVRCWIRSMS